MTALGNTSTHSPTQSIRISPIPIAHYPHQQPIIPTHITNLLLATRSTLVSASRIRPQEMHGRAKGLQRRTRGCRFQGNVPWGMSVSVPGHGSYLIQRHAFGVQEKVSGVPIPQTIQRVFSASPWGSCINPTTLNISPLRQGAYENHDLFTK